MIADLVRRYPHAALVVAFFAGVVMTMIIGGTAIALTRGTPPVTVGAPELPNAGATLPAESASPSPSGPDGPSIAPPTLGSSEPADCPAATTTVHDADGLHAALAAAGPGDVITMESGTYTGNFVAGTSGTEAQPIHLCGPQDAVLDGGDPEEGYVLHLDRAAYWRLVGFTVANGQKGVMADTTIGSVLQGLTVHTIGDEAIHLRTFSTDNLVVDNTISNTGLRKPKFGEGVYVGTAESNWCEISECEPDRSDRNVVQGNHISGTRSESVDIKEGTEDGIVRGNTFDGSAIVGADSWVDVKGNHWLIEGNRGTNSPLDGFQTHEIVDGWGTDNVFRSNTAVLNGPGYGFSLTPVRDNVVECNNTVSAAGEGASNVPCTG
jgi:hypothetical protein